MSKMLPCLTFCLANNLKPLQMLILSAIAIVGHSKSVDNFYVICFDKKYLFCTNDFRQIICFNSGPK